VTTFGKHRPHPPARSIPVAGVVAELDGEGGERWDEVLVAGHQTPAIVRPVLAP
jgi:hypothetical protein